MLRKKKTLFHDYLTLSSDGRFVKMDDRCFLQIKATMTVKLTKKLLGTNLSCCWYFQNSFASCSDIIQQTCAVNETLITLRNRLIVSLECPRLMLEIIGLSFWASNITKSIFSSFFFHCLASYELSTIFLSCKKVSKPKKKNFKYTLWCFCED